jgi:hypothetical protein
MCTFPVGITVMRSVVARLPLGLSSPPSGATVQPGNRLANHSAVVRSITITDLGFVSSGFLSEIRMAA